MVHTYPCAPAARRPALHLLLLLTLLIPFLTAASDTQHMVPLTLQERVQQADFVLEGEVISQQSFWDARHENIYTSNIIKVYKRFKGNLEAELVEVITEGGTVGLKKHVYSTALQLRPGQQGLFFLNRQQQLQRTPGNTALSTSAYGSQQGFVQYNLGNRSARGVFDIYTSVEELYQQVTQKTGQRYKVLHENKRLQEHPENVQHQQQSSLLAPIITSFSPTVASAGTGQILTINGRGFGSSRGEGFVEFRNADDGGQTYVRPLETEYISWSDTRIRMYIPSVTQDRGTAGSGTFRVTTNAGETFTSLTELTLEFAYSNIDFDEKSFKPILIAQDNDGGYTINFAPSMQDRLMAKEGFRRAMNSWVCETQVNWKIGPGTTKEAATDDGLVVIRFAPASTVGSGVLARTISRYEGCANDSDTLFWVSEFDMEINSNIQWQYGPGAPTGDQFDFETVILHELGHAHQLSHVNLPRAVMFYAIEARQLVRDLSPIDIEGGNLIMGFSTGDNFCEQPPIVPTTEGECNLAPEILTLEAEFTNNTTVLLSWTTREELNISEFVVQRSPDGRTWTDIGTVDARGPSLGDLDYTFTDNDPLRNQSYYRLQVVYTSGETSFSPRVTVLNPSDLRVLRLSPNPVGGSEGGLLTLRYLVNSTATLQFQMYDMKGQIVREFSLDFIPGSSTVQLDLSDLAGGIYFLKWQYGNLNGLEKVLKL